MKKIGTLALTLALAGSMTVPALAAEETAVPISADTGYGTALVLNGETLDLTGIPGVEGGTLLPLRLLAEADHGSAYWDEENNESWFYFGDNRITVKFADNSVWVDDEQVKSQAYVTGGVTFVEAGVLEMLEGYTAEQAEDGSSITITTPNGTPFVQGAYAIRDAAGVYSSMKSGADVLVENYGVPEGALEEAVAFFPMITSPDTVILGKLAEGADVEAVKAAWTGAPIKTLDLYVKPEDGAVYYVVNGGEGGKLNGAL